jgi:HPt (histidine-containing phosphotransfer) domain-containing protein
MNHWRDEAEMDQGVVDALKGIVGADAFSEMAKQFEVDLMRLYQSYQQARSESDECAARDAAHAMKGAASNIGLTRLGALAGLLETGSMDDVGELGPVLTSAIEHLNTRAV